MLNVFFSFKMTCLCSIRLCYTSILVDIIFLHIFHQGILYLLRFLGTSKKQINKTLLKWLFCSSVAFKYFFKYTLKLCSGFRNYLGKKKLKLNHYRSKKINYFLFHLNTLNYRVIFILYLKISKWFMDIIFYTLLHLL